MDLAYDDDQQAIAELAERILAEQCPPETLRTLESRDHFAADAWAALAAADLLGLALPTDVGGSGLGLLDAALVAEATGRNVALVPYWSSTAAALTIAHAGTADQTKRWLSGVADGSSRLAVALWNPTELGRPTVDSDGLLHGELLPVPWSTGAHALVVTAGLDDGVGAFVVEAAAPGVEVVDEQVITGEPTQSIRLDGAKAERLGDADTAEWLQQRTRALLLATVLGVCEGALAITAKYVSERQQFGSPIGTFQAVAHRAADAYVDTEAIRLTTLQALWRLDAGLDATGALDVAAFWAAEGSHRVVHAAQHLHGGIGMDLDYPIHRYFRWAKGLEALLGGRHSALVPLGAALAAGDDPTT
jgi:alkylation response protein AidB-like acyl-CoA dehydrogenase